MDRRAQRHRLYLHGFVLPRSNRFSLKAAQRLSRDHQRIRRYRDSSMVCSLPSLVRAMVAAIRADQVNCLMIAKAPKRMSGSTSNSPCSFAESMSVRSFGSRWVPVEWKISRHTPLDLVHFRPFASDPISNANGCFPTMGPKPVDSTLYTCGAQAVYERLAHLSETLLENHFSVIVDATFFAQVDPLLVSFDC